MRRYRTNTYESVASLERGINDLNKANPKFRVESVCFAPYEQQWVLVYSIRVKKVLTTPSFYEDDSWAYPAAVEKTYMDTESGYGKTSYYSWD